MKMFEYFEDYLKKNIYPFHMPGNKRKDGYRNDFTEVEGLDNLYYPQGIIKESLERIKNLYGTKESYILVNGSTAGILAAITAVTKKGDHILVARNCHKSVYNAVDIWNLVPHYVMPKVICGMEGEISPLSVERELKNNNIKACVITSPTYEGIVSDIKGIAQVCRKYGVILIVDEAHGSHLRFSPYFPVSAVECGADIVIHSTHKTLTSLTGTGLLHICSDRVEKNLVGKRLGYFQTSSPNYIMMASVDRCICDIMENGNRMFSEYTGLLEDFYRKSEDLENLSVFRGGGVFGFDKGKIVISTAGTNISGTVLQSLLREKYLIEVEMSNINYALALTSINDSREGFIRLTDALFEIDGGLEKNEETQSPVCHIKPQIKYNIWETEDMERESLPLENSIGRVSARYIYAYPPGSPIVAPGEVMTKDIVCEIMRMVKNKVNVISEEGNLPISVQVLLTHKEK